MPGLVEPWNGIELAQTVKSFPERSSSPVSTFLRPGPTFFPSCNAIASKTPPGAKVFCLPTRLRQANDCSIWARHSDRSEVAACHGLWRRDWSRARAQQESSRTAHQRSDLYWRCALHDRVASY